VGAHIGDAFKCGSDIQLIEGREIRLPNVFDDDKGENR